MWLKLLCALFWLRVVLLKPQLDEDCELYATDTMVRLGQGEVETYLTALYFLARLLLRTALRNAAV